MAPFVDLAMVAAPPLPEAFHTTHASAHPLHLQQLASTVLHNLQHQHDWSLLSIHTHSESTGQLLPRPVISGLPPRRAYIHPDEQVATLKLEHDTGIPVKQLPEGEWVLPTHLGEKWSLKQFAAIFDALDTVPPTDEIAPEEENSVGQQWQGNNRQKRLLLATLHDDSTIVYYIMHDGIVKPRQN
ncbi:hypothetical protein BP6252_07893 [Coleophoma cylindrospora]|uniref:tRNA-splicing endonuclease subunit Sen15 domain-containing protein n=1 Tax=Coleophoma cylindrospora TaxID=1849047 RepID=A0A3D8RBH2_9HELO|nr:hypothetical protein BP6252_07893 [Coleophoma cylindrospora]